MSRTPPASETIDLLERCARVEWPGGIGRVAGHDVARLGYGTMQLPGPGVWGPPRDRETALAILRRAVALAVNHIDTAQFYGDGVSNELIRTALHPYPERLVLLTKVGAAPDAQGGWIPAQRPERLRADVEANLRTLGVELGARGEPASGGSWPPRL